MLGLIPLVSIFSWGLPEGDVHSNCEGVLKGERRHHVVFSGRESSEDQVQLAKYADELFNPGGVLDKLGMNHPEQTIQFLSGKDLNSIVANGRLPVGHWHDGANVVSTVKKGSSILEMVIHGQKVRHSIYRDDLTAKQQFSILNHVAGHVHFGMNTKWLHTGTTELNQAAYELDALMEELKLRHSRDEISEWYQQLLSLEMAQDLILAEYNTPEDFRFDPDKQFKADHDLGVRTKRNHPVHPTANLLQAFVANLPPTTPTWKREMAEMFERLNRYIPGAIRTKIMNEGWATLMQEFLPPHTSSYGTFDHAMEYCCLISGVAVPGLSNPYWLGLEAWRNIRRKFNDRPENQGLSPLERDKAFVKHAAKLMSTMDDADFLRYGLDADWVVKHNLVLSRPLKQDEEWDYSIPRTDPREEWQYTILSRDPERILKAVILQTAQKFPYTFPRPVLTHLSDSGVVRLEISDDVGRRIPMNKASVVKTLYVMSQILDRPVSLEATFTETGRVHRKAPWDFDAFYEWEETVNMSKRARVTVGPNGELMAEEVHRDGSPDPEKIEVNEWQVAVREGVHYEYLAKDALGDELKVFLEDFKKDLELAEIKKLLPESSLHAVNGAIETAVGGVSTHLMLSVPTVPHAVKEYEQEVQQRAFRALQLALLGQRGIQHRFSGVAIKVLPDIPSFQFSKEGLEEFFKELPAPAPDALKISAASGGGIPEDLPGEIDSRDGQPGKRFWGPDPNKKPGGGSGEGEPGEGNEPGDERGNQAGEGGLDPSYMEFDLETYADALNTMVELPNLRPKDGPSLMRDEVRDTWARRRSGRPETGVITRKAFAKGLAYYKGLQNESDSEESEDLSPQNLQKILRKGFSLIDVDRDWAVKSFSTQPTPDVNAQVTLVIDLSGSYDAFVKKTKQMFYDIRALLLKKYKSVTFRFVAFDGSAHAFEDPEEFFRLRLGGGTSYATALNKVIEVQEEFPEAKFDRYVLLAGDMEDFDFGGSERSVTDILDQLVHQSQFFASVRMAYSPAPGYASIEKDLRRRHDEDPYVSFVDLALENNHYEPLVLRRVFKNENP